MDTSDTPYARHRGRPSPAPWQLGAQLRRCRRARAGAQAMLGQPHPRAYLVRYCIPLQREREFVGGRAASRFEIMRLSQDERAKIQAMTRQGYTKACIRRQLNVSRDTVSRWGAREAEGDGWPAGPASQRRAAQAAGAAARGYEARRLSRQHRCKGHTALQLQEWPESEQEHYSAHARRWRGAPGVGAGEAWAQAVRRESGAAPGVLPRARQRPNTHLGVCG
jgi:transposase